MSTYYVWDEGDNSTGASWATAKTTLDAGHALCAAGDTLLVASDHTETLTAACSLGEPTAAGAPILCYTVNRTTGNLETMEVGGGLITQSTYIVSFQSASAYYYGLKFTYSGTSSGVWLGSVSNQQIANYLDNCSFAFTSINSAVRMGFGCSGTNNPRDILAKLENCKVKFGATTQGFNVYTIGQLVIDNHGSDFIDSSGYAPASLFKPTGGDSNVHVMNTDLSTITGALIDPSGNHGGIYRFSNCSLGSGCTVFTASTWPPGYGGINAFLEGCDSADAGYRFERHNYCGDMTTDTGIYRNSGASAPSSKSGGSDPQPVSWKVVTTANPSFVFPFELPPIYQWYGATTDGTPKTITVCYNQDNATNLNNDEIWMEVDYMGTDGSVLATVDRDDRKADILASAAAQDDDAGSTWTGTGGWSNENKQKMVATIAPREKGYIVVRVYIAKASATLYVDPLITVS